MTEWYKNLPEGQRKHYKNRDVIVSPGTQENRLFVLEQGSARICLLGSSREQTLGYLKQGSIYVTHTPTWVEAMEETTTRSWPLSQVKALFASHPEVAVGTIREVGIMLKNAIDMIEDLAFRPVESRLARYLLTESRQQKKDTIRLIGNTEILASLLGTSRQTTSTILNRFEKQGMIERPDRQHIHLIEKSRLQQISETLSAS